MTQLLCRHGASIEAADAEGFRPLAYAANWAGDIGQGQQGQESLVALKFLLDRGAAIDAVNVDGATALMIAVDEVRWCGMQCCRCRTTRPALAQCQLTCGCGMRRRVCCCWLRARKAAAAASTC